jgi:hypothetical protein
VVVEEVPHHPLLAVLVAVVEVLLLQHLATPHSLIILWVFQFYLDNLVVLLVAILLLVQLAVAVVERILVAVFVLDILELEVPSMVRWNFLMLVLVVLVEHQLSQE